MNLRERLEDVPQVGRVEWIGLAAEKRAPLVSTDAAQVAVGTGFAGEHHASTGKGKRQVTLIQHEHFPVMSSILGSEVHPADTRRNVVVSGVNLASFRNRRFRVGDVLLEWSQTCHPCGRMDENLGPGGLQAMRGHGGICAVVLEPGTLRVGDAVSIAPSGGEEQEDADSSSR